MTDHDDPVTELLKRARRRISRPEQWTTGTYARDRAEDACSPTGAGAVRFCALGALEASLPNGEGRRRREGWYERFFEARRRLQTAAGGGPPVRIQQCNDRDGHAAVLAMYDEAIRQK